MAVNICKQGLLFLKTVACSTTSVAAISKHWDIHHKVYLTSVLQSVVRLVPRCMATQAWTEEERRSRQEFTEKKSIAHAEFPFLQNKSNEHVYVLDSALAAEIAKSVRENQVDPKIPVLEVNPGPGVLTRALFGAGVQRIVAAEALKEFIPYLELQQKHGRHNLTVCHWDYWEISSQSFEMNSKHRKHEEMLTKCVQHRPWADGPPLTIIGVIPNKRERPFIRRLMMTCSQQLGLLVYGRPEWFLVISPAFYKHMACARFESGIKELHLLQHLMTVQRGGNRNVFLFDVLAVTVHLMFDIHLCAEFPGWKFVPSFPEKKSKKKLDDLNNVSDDMRYLVYLRPRDEQYLPLPEFIDFYIFLSQLTKKKKQRLIFKMEQLVPGCGIHLIIMGFSMMQHIVEVTPAQYANIFKAMKTWPEFAGSPLQQHLSQNSFEESDNEDCYI